MIQFRCSIIPESDIGEGQGLGEAIIPLGSQFQIPVKEDAVGLVADLCVNLCGFRQLQPEADIAGGQILVKGTLDPQVLRKGLGIEVHGTENAGETEEVLILQPGAGAALVHFHAQPVALLPDIGSQVEIRRGEAVLAVAHKGTIAPEVEGCLHTLEGYAHFSSRQAGGQVKFPDIAAHSIALPVDMGRAQLCVTVPGIELVGILDLTESLGLDVAGHRDGAEGGQVKILLPEVSGPGSGIFAEGKAPASVQALAQGGFGLLRGSIADVIGMGIQAVHPENFRVFQPIEIRQHSKVLLIVNFYDKYTKGPIFRQPRQVGKATKENMKTLVAFPNLLKSLPNYWTQFVVSSY